MEEKDARSIINFSCSLFLSTLLKLIKCHSEMDTYLMFYSYNIILYENELSTATHINQDESHKYNIKELSKLYHLSDSIYINY